MVDVSEIPSQVETKRRCSAMTRTGRSCRVKRIARSQARTINYEILCVNKRIRASYPGRTGSKSTAIYRLTPAHSTKQHGLRALRRIISAPAWENNNDQTRRSEPALHSCYFAECEANGYQRETRRYLLRRSQPGRRQRAGRHKTRFDRTERYRNRHSPTVIAAITSQTSKAACHDAYLPRHDGRTPGARWCCSSRSTIDKRRLQGRI